MSALGLRGPLGYRAASGWFAAAAFAALIAADFHVASLDPWADLRRLLAGLARPDFASLALLSVVHTVAFAVLGVGIGAGAGFLTAIPYARSRTLRVLCAMLRSVHELFWALLLMQVFGLSATTGILAIALPYAGICAKVFSEIIEEADLSALRVLPPGTGTVSAFAYARLPEVAASIRHYTLYRFECGLRSTLVLGFVGLPTMGFHLESAFRQGRYGEAAAFLLAFYALIGTRRLWVRGATLPFLIGLSPFVLPTVAGSPDIAAGLLRFLTHTVVPSPLRDGALLDPATWARLWSWFRPILTGQIVPGTIQTLVLAQVALASTALGALVLFPLTARRFTGPLGRPLGRALLVVVRSTPEYMLAYVLLQLLGPSMLPAILALAIHNAGIVGYLMGRHADGLAYRPDAPSGLNLYAYETLPRLYGQFLAYLLYRWEIILREGAILGLIGVATLGFYVDAAISELRIDVAVVLILATMLVTLAVEALSRALRRALRIADLPTRLSRPLATDSGG
ncbi:MULTISPECIES: ABC transporter permease [Methylobacterium]|uniref:Phosphate-import permease protein PhnE n=4 Tax=Pseudomonadota TaxID=1224 RepID=A0ABQ4SZQ0_9HYPH|nr:MULTISPECIES: ABC transporter permease [Methylobacterium]PIU07983.1 MAG: ABC transporter permease [Methylobacterium sp. CG09_land_8_20_14_0_10_71_15]PIU15777.1 MAG: ABC transporter permease [Methylobacterium sp. CG08_land_8_20_14_0_20_71_15]GBU17908.1 phosphate-import permease protein PhnE [Methylobacterium sp.]GJE08562.1 Phosphate-import permease protein PhnE [Methylobacterium jeotgali]